MITTDLCCIDTPKMEIDFRDESAKMRENDRILMFGMERVISLASKSCRFVSSHFHYHRLQFKRTLTTALRLGRCQSNGNRLFCSVFYDLWLCGGH